MWRKFRPSTTIWINHKKPLKFLLVIKKYERAQFRNSRLTCCPTLLAIKTWLFSNIQADKTDQNHMLLNRQNQSHASGKIEFVVCTVKWMWESSIFPSIKPKLDIGLCVDFCVFTCFYQFFHDVIIRFFVLICRTILWSHHAKPGKNR